MIDRFTESAERVLKLARKASSEMGHDNVGTEHILLGLLREEHGTAAAVLKENHVREAEVVELIRNLIKPASDRAVAEKEEYTPRAQSVLRQADAEAQMSGLDRIGTEHILLALVEDVDCSAARLLHTMHVNLQTLYKTLLDILDAPEERSRDLMKAIRAGGEDFASETGFLDQFSTDLTAKAREGRLDPIVGREKETERILQILCRRTKNNPCLIGEPGVGKTAIIEGLAQKIASGNVPPQLAGKRIVTLDMAGMVAGSKYRGEFEERMKQVLEEVMRSRDVLLFIDELHTIIGAGGAEGSLDASNIMKPFLSRGEVQVIGATTVEEYRKYVEKDSALERRFQPVMIEEPSDEETVQILMGIRPVYEQHHNVTIPDDAILEAVKLSKRYINDRFLPDKAIDLMDEAAARRQLAQSRIGAELARMEAEYAQLILQLEDALKEDNVEEARAIRRKQEEMDAALKKERSRQTKKLAKVNGTLTTEDIASVISVWTGIPASRVASSEGKRLLLLEKELHKRVIGQEEAVTAVARAIKRGRAGLKDPRRPIGSFLFLGPTGVGKTELSKALAAAVFGDEQSMIRVDMSEYMEKHSVSKLVGSPPGYVGYEEGGQLSDKVRSHPYSVILFDEIEKAHPDVFNILLQVLDEGHITDSQGRKVDFKNTILIMTSNAGAQSILSPKHLGFGTGDTAKADYEKMKSSVLEEIRKIFKPEFLNRIDDIIVFHSLEKEQIRSITDLLLSGLADRAREQMGILLKVRKPLREFLAEKGFDPKFGARPLKRAIQNEVEDPLSEEILAGRVKPGDTVTADRKDGKTHFAVSGSKAAVKKEGSHGES